MCLNSEAGTSREKSSVSWLTTGNLMRSTFAFIAWSGNRCGANIADAVGDVSRNTISKNLSLEDFHTILTSDSHCPWIDNCVGVNNLRHFVLYIVSLEIGILLFIQLTISCECWHCSMCRMQANERRYRAVTGPCRASMQHHQ